MYRKVMVSYVFTYQLLQEQNIFLENAIAQMEQQIKDMKKISISLKKSTPSTDADFFVMISIHFFNF